MKTRVVWEGGSTQVELVPENANEVQVLSMLDEKTEASVRLEWDGPVSRPHRKIIKLVLTV